MDQGGVTDQFGIDLAGAGFKFAILIGGIIIIGGFIVKRKEYKKSAWIVSLLCDHCHPIASWFDCLRFGKQIFFPSGSPVGTQNSGWTRTAH
jgi:hypothetical protein